MEETALGCEYFSVSFASKFSYFFVNMSHRQRSKGLYVGHGTFSELGFYN